MSRRAMLAAATRMRWSRYSSPILLSRSNLSTGRDFDTNSGRFWVGLIFHLFVKIANNRIKATGFPNLFVFG
jgi:hypothetical protein